MFTHTRTRLKVTLPGSCMVSCIGVRCDTPVFFVVFFAFLKVYFAIFVAADNLKVVCRTKMANTLLTAASVQSFIARPFLHSLAVVRGAGEREERAKDAK